MPVRRQIGVGGTSTIDNLSNNEQSGEAMKLMMSVLFCLLCIPLAGVTQESPYNGLNNNLGNLSRLSNAQSFSVSPENLTGEKGKGGMATQGSASLAARDLGQ